MLVDIAVRGEWDGYWILGDLVAIGAEPVEVLNCLTALPNARIIRGNTDRYVFAGDRPPPTLAEVRANPDLLPVLVEVESDFAWTQGAVSATGWPIYNRSATRLLISLPGNTRMVPYE